MAPSTDAHKKSSKEMCDANCILQSLQRTSKGLVLKAPLLLNLNCEKILAKKIDFIACVKSIKKDLSNDV